MHGGLRFSRHVDPRGFVGAVQFLTRVPVQGGAYDLGDAVVWLPVVGCLLGVALAAIDAGLRWLHAPTLLSATLLVVLLLVLTGALHADGLMDTCDAVFGHASPERRLEIMRDPRAGAFGVVGVVCVIAMKIAAIDGLTSDVRPLLLVATPTLGRWAIVFLAALFPYGRSSGLGAPLKVAATPAALLLASVVPVVVCALLGPVGLLIGGVAVASAYGLGRWLVSLLPGLTGDCYGAACELVEMVVLVCGAFVAH
jgi:adenosylcobinamide-GDP ribazoletransferase